MREVVYTRRGLMRTCAWPLAQICERLVATGKAYCKVADKIKSGEAGDKQVRSAFLFLFLSRPSFSLSRSNRLKAKVSLLCR